MKRRSFLKRVIASVVAVFVPIPVLANKVEESIDDWCIEIKNDDILVWAQRYYGNEARWRTRVIIKGSDGWVCVYQLDEEERDTFDYVEQTRQQFKNQVDWFDQVGRDNVYYQQHAEINSTRYYFNKVQNGNGLTIYDKSSPHHEKICNEN